MWIATEFPENALYSEISFFVILYACFLQFALEIVTPFLLRIFLKKIPFQLTRWIFFFKKK